MSEQLICRLARPDEKQAIIDFMDVHWGSKHPLVHLEDFFNHYYVDDGKLQFAFAESDSEKVALAGYILTNHREHPDIWVSIWCAKKGYNGAGLELMAALPDLVGARIMACNNIRPKTMPFYTFLGYTAARLPHYYRLADKAVYAVARVADRTILPCGDGVLPARIASAQELAAFYTPDETVTPLKDTWYLERRYFKYPRQKYDVWRVGTCLLVTRTVPVNGTCVLRVVDFLGRPAQFSSMGRAIDALMQQTGAEYADCYCAGISPEIMKKAGLCERAPDSPNIIPNYLTPPLYENTEYYYFVTQPIDFMMFKADGDQDRPNIEL